MTNLKIGDWVVPDDGKITPPLRIMTIFRTAYGDNLGFSYDKNGDACCYRRASIMDYIRTFDVEQMERFLFREDGCAGICIYRFEECWNEEFNCHKGIKQWLNQPLTDKLVKQLGGKIK